MATDCVHEHAGPQECVEIPRIETVPEPERSNALEQQGRNISLNQTRYFQTGGNDWPVQRENDIASVELILGELRPQLLRQADSVSPVDAPLRHVRVSK